MDKTKQQSKQQQKRKMQAQANILEAMKDIGGHTAKAFTNDLLKETPKDFLRQLMGMRAPAQNRSGEMRAGESVNMKDVFTGKREADEKLHKQIAFERRLLEEEKVLIERRSNELKLELHAVQQEVQMAADSTAKLSKELQIAAIQNVVNPGISDIRALEAIRGHIRGYRLNTESAAVWLHSYNKRGQKKNFWDQYKVQKGQHLLNPEHFSQRSAG